MSSNARHVLVIGYGNPHRQDDRAGHAVAAAVNAWRARDSVPNVTVETAFQLDLNMVEDIIGASHVFFIDAHLADYSADVEVQEIAPAHARNFTTHLFTPPDLMALAHELYGKEPRGWIVSVPGTHFDLSDDMSPHTEEKITEAAERLIALITGILGEQDL